MSGLPWAATFFSGANLQPYKYGGEEFVEMHGLDEYDSEARWYYPALMCTTTMEPMAEMYYSISPYAWCGNNPVNFVDPDGRVATETLFIGAISQPEVSLPILAGCAIGAAAYCGLRVATAYALNHPEDAVAFVYEVKGKIEDGKNIVKSTYETLIKKIGSIDQFQNQNPNSSVQDNVTQENTQNNRYNFSKKS